jgi:fatty acid desaturase
VVNADGSQSWSHKSDLKIIFRRQSTITPLPRTTSRRCFILSISTHTHTYIYTYIYIYIYIYWNFCILLFSAIANLKIAFSFDFEHDLKHGSPSSSPICQLCIYYKN